MNSLDDTIAAVSTPPGEGGIGIVRLSGRDALALAGRVFVSPRGKPLTGTRSHTILHGFAVNPADGARIDEVLVTVMRAPATYTREDVVEINCHGGIVPLRAVLQALLDAGARLAEPGEFTKRAFLNGRIDLIQAEAVIDVIRAKTETAERIAQQQLEGRLSRRIAALRERVTELCAHVEAYIDFPEDEIEPLPASALLGAMAEIEAELAGLSQGYAEGKFFREGVSAAIVGKPNVGKSSLLNALLEKDRAIVTEIPGTTRDVIEDVLNIKGLPLRIMDTAGIRETHNLAEQEGVKRSVKAIEGADLVIAVLDAGRELDDADREVLDRIARKRAMVVVNKCDILSPRFAFTGYPGDAVRVSALTGEGIEAVRQRIYELCIASGSGHDREDLLVTNLRHKHALDRALQSLAEARQALETHLPLEVVALFLRESLDHLGGIIGAVTTEDILERIFSAFCIGK
ncbi:MAG: tRNA uridine-5-carboxymethylaminomethyl(34) synthesis GTPase MnmE [Nitrospirota bacterium]